MMTIQNSAIKLLNVLNILLNVIFFKEIHLIKLNVLSVAFIFYNYYAIVILIISFMGTLHVRKHQSAIII